MASAEPANIETKLRATVAELLEEMAEATGDGRFRTAAAMVRGARGGRRAKDDTEALQYAAGLFNANLVESRHRACEMAAVLFAPSHQVETMRDRLRRKLRRELFKSEDGGKERR